MNMAGSVTGRRRVLVLAAVSIGMTCLLYYRSNTFSQEAFTFNDIFTFDIGASSRSQTQATKVNNEKSTKVNSEKSTKELAADVSRWLKDVLKLHQKFEQKTLDSCNNTCVLEKEVCQAKDVPQWEKLLGSEKLKTIRLFGNDEGIFPWEKDYLSRPPLDDINKLPNLTLSKVHYLSERGSTNLLEQIKCKKNDRLNFRADLIDSYGEHRKLGGDDVRAWITGEEGTPASTGSVRDFGNGTYLVTVTPTWTGKVKSCFETGCGHPVSHQKILGGVETIICISVFGFYFGAKLNVAVVYPREYLRAALYHMKEGRHRFIFGQFKKSNITEVTICHTTPNIPGRPCVCNYTTWNRRPYYCGRPLDKRLSCQDWVAIKSAPGPTLKDYTPAEIIMAGTMARPLHSATIEHSIQIQSTNNDTFIDPLPSCTEVKDKSFTWNHESPRGMWRSGKKWESFVCKEPPLTSKWAESCLKSTKIWMIGDSNMYLLEKSLRGHVSFTPRLKPNMADWPVERSGTNKNCRTTNSARGHEYPLFHYLSGRWHSLLDQGGVEDFLGKISSTGNHVVVIHYNLHFSISHLSAIFQRFLAIRQAVKDLLRRNPSVLVAIRGPHISAVEWSRNHLFGGDVQGIFILKLLHIVFEEMKHKIVFLDGWDMTISLRNTAMHPPIEVTNAMVRTLLSVKCS